MTFVDLILLYLGITVVNASVNGDIVWTAVVLAVMTFVSVALIRVVGGWLLQSAKEDFQESVRKVVRDEMRDELRDMRAELIPSDEIRSTELKLGLQIGWLMAAVRKVADHVGLDIDEPPG